MTSVVLDASSVIALVRNEPGADRVRAVGPGALLSSVNLAEVVSRLWERGMNPEAVRRSLEQISLQVVPFDEYLAYLTARLRGATRSAQLSLADRACLALAVHRRLPVLTADSRWARVKIGVDIRFVRTR